MPEVGGLTLGGGLLEPRISPLASGHDLPSFSHKNDSPLISGKQPLKAVNVNLEKIETEIEDLKE